ncbi:hypothetical protein CTI12_AA447170 [Artemisia annua]|uniref:Uncharacterized protein n=1 Tax=Artemisia annua TaxID=35608 RepID=A0A2U1LW13_ARTAN|nr:hypothetical protein CTI12_AA447170 [Artemisia annua]
MGRRKFCLKPVSALGDISLSHLQACEVPFHETVFPGKRVLKGKDLYQLLEDQNFKLLSEPDALRVLPFTRRLTIALCVKRSGICVKEFSALIDGFGMLWNAFPWGGAYVAGVSR